MRRRIAAVATLLAAAGLLAAVPAQASFHLIKVREVFPGSVAHPDSDYVELQMYASGQNLVQHGNLEIYNATGIVRRNFTPGQQVANGANQSTVLMAGAEYAAQFPGAPAPDFTVDLNLNPAAGAVCWPQTEPPFDDCASWGAFSGQELLASKDAAPAASGGIPDGMAIRRSIAAKCPTLLEDGDDADNSSVDFSVVSPAPRSNASPIGEQPCVTALPPSGQPFGVPQTTLRRRPARRTHDRTPTFSFASSQQGSSFECAFDRHRFRICRSPLTTRPLSFGRHRLSVRARGAVGIVDPSPVSYSFRVVPRR